MSTIQHVLIVGAGLGGPALALCLARNNIRSTIFEIRPTPSSGGGSLTLQPEALELLDRYVGVYDRLKSGGYQYRRLTAYTDVGEKLGEIIVGQSKDVDKGYPALRIMRGKLHEALIAAAEEMPELITFKYGVTLSSVDETEKGVTVHFEDGSQAQGDLLIGADGIHSKVREHVLGSAAPTPEFTNVYIVTGFVPTDRVVLPHPEFTFPAMLVSPNGMFMTFPIDPEGKTLAWGINKGGVEAKTRQGWKDFEQSGEGARLAKLDYADVTTQPMRSILDNADDKEAKLWSPHSIPDIPRWQTSKVVLIGDAAHSLPPNGQGSALAFEDAAVLTKLITSAQGKEISTDTILARFEALRRPRIEKVRKFTKGYGSAVKSKSSPPVWFLKKWMFRGWFAWNGGEVVMGKDLEDEVAKAALE